VAEPGVRAARYVMWMKTHVQVAQRLRSMELSFTLSTT